MNLIEKLKKNSKIKEISVLEESTFFSNKEEVTTPIPALNIALSGSLTGGMQPGILQIAGPSKHFKSSISLVLASSYMRKYPDSVLMFYDSEFGSPKEYFKTFGIDTSRVLHNPITDIEELKFDIMSQLNQINRGDKVIFLIDSVGNLASKKEVEDALNEKSVADMSRAKQLKSLFRIITPHLTIKNLPMIIINHVYQEMGMFPKTIVSGGSGGYYSSNDIWIIGRTQEKDGTDITGYTFTINIEKSRRVKEKSKIPLVVTFDGGISKWSGLLDLALEAGLVIKPSNGWYQKVNQETNEPIERKYRVKDTNSPEFWEDILSSKKFNNFVREKYQLVGEQVLLDDGEE